MVSVALVATVTFEPRGAPSQARAGATLAAVGAGPWRRRSFGAMHGLFLGIVGCALGLAVGVPSGLAFTQVDGLPGVDVPWVSSLGTVASVQYFANAVSIGTSVPGIRIGETFGRIAVAVERPDDELTREQFLRVVRPLHERLRCERPGTMARPADHSWQFALFDQPFAPAPFAAFSQFVITYRNGNQRTEPNRYHCET